MDIRESFSRLKKKLKHPMAGRKRKPDGIAIDAGGEGVDPAGSLPRQEPHVVADGGHNREGEGSNSDRRQIRLTDRPPLPDEPESTSARGNDQEEGEADVNRGEASQVYSHSHSGVEVVVESEPSREGNDVDGENTERDCPPPPAPPIPRGEKPDSV